MTEIQNSKQGLDLKGFGHWIFEFVICLEFGAWNLYFFTYFSTEEPKNSYSRNAGTLQCGIRFYPAGPLHPA